MARKHGTLTAALVALGVAGAGWWVMSGGEVEGTKALVNQVWIEKVPQDDRDQIAHLLVLEHPRARNFGVAGRSSQWRHQVEVFMWELHQGTLDLRFPQDRLRSRLKARTWECEGEAPRPFELCLELSRGDRKIRMYSRRDWVVDPQDAESSLEDLVADTPELRGLVLDEPGPLAVTGDAEWAEVDFRF